MATVPQSTPAVSAAQRLIVIPLEEVLGIEIRCECGMEVIYDAASAVKPNCPRCNRDFGTVALALKGLREFVQENEDRKVAFRIKRDTHG